MSPIKIGSENKNKKKSRILHKTRKLNENIQVEIWAYKTFFCDNLN
jgi:hypothetical protein